MIHTDKTFDNKPISYKVDENGYTIYLDSKPWIDQHEPYGKPMSSEKSYEENCLMQIDEIVAGEEQQSDIEARLESAEEQITDTQMAVCDLYEIIEGGI